ncbi:MAG: hypothetical protein M3Z04_22690, partial [Chloroflexota bacterium]|nr:hypothetical protein [Chloroflexota bacterium]
FAYLIQTSGLSQRALADHLGKNRNYIRRRLWLLTHRPELFSAIRAGQISQHRALDLADSLESDAAHSEPNSTAGSSVAHSEPNSTAGSSMAQSAPAVLVNGHTVAFVPDSSGPRTPRAELPPPGPPARWRDLTRARTWLGKIQPTTVPVAERAALVQELEDLETQAAVARRALLAQMERVS